MKPVKLSIKGLNSFIEEQTIDFERLASIGLFGVFGPTGSGKSTIVDAITMALYGEMSRYDNDKKSKQCINTACDSMSVCFEFDIGREGGYIRYGAFRSYKRKADKSMETLLSRLYKMDGKETVILADKPTKMKEEITALIGLNYDDFSRSVVLPQGKFSDFLLLGNKERRDMLERIFGLEKYGEALNRKIRSAANHSKNQLALTEKSLEFYGDLNQEKIKSEQKSLDEAESTLEVLKAQQQELTKEHSYLLRIKELQTRRKANRVALALQKDLFQKTQIEEVNQRKLYESAYRDKEEQYPLLIRKATQLNQAEILYKEADQLENQRKQLLDRYTSKKKEFVNTVQKTEESEAKIILLKNELQKIIDEKKEIAMSSEYRQNLHEAYSIWRQEAEEEKKRKILYNKLNKSRDSLISGKKNMRDRLEELQSLREELGIKTGKTAALQKQKKIKLAELEEQLRQADMENMATTLAHGLNEGQPCPVCGAMEHPMKAKGLKMESDKLLKKRNALQKESQELEIGLLALIKNLAAMGEAVEAPQNELEEVEKENDLLLSELETMSERYNQLFHSISSIRQSIAKDEAFLAELEKEASEAGEEKEKRQQLLRLYTSEFKIERIEEAYKQMLLHDKERSRLELQEGKQRSALEENEKELSVLRSRRSDLAVGLQELKTLGLEKKESLENSRGKIKAVIGNDEPTHLPTLQKEVQKETDQLLQREEKLKKDLDILEQQSKIIYNELAALEKQAETLDELWRENNEKIPAAASIKEEDLNEIEASSNRALVSCQEEVSKKVSLIAVLKERISKMVKDLETVTRLNREKKGLNRQLDMLTDLTGLFEGNRFVEFVAKRQLAYIAADASRRLKEMSSGRYALELDGTDFIMRDDGCGGIRRSPRTLSGGETFSVSLCLALALSAKIQLKNSAPLEFFFLDEGFGTLDPSMLEVVMNVLECLPSEKMKVGLITHVEELKNRIPMKLDLTPAEQGLHGTIISQ